MDTLTSEELKIPVIIDVVSKELGVDSVLDNSHKRNRELVENRAIAMYFIKKYTKLSLSRIGKAFGKDHATVLHACKLFLNLFDTDATFRTKAVNCRFKLNDICPILDEVKPDTVKSPYETISYLKKANVALINRHMTYKEHLEKIEKAFKKYPLIHKKYFNGIDLIYSHKKKNSRVGVVSGQ